MDAGWWGVLISILIGIPTLFYAWRATDISEKAHAHQLRRDRELKRANLEFAPEPHGEKIWQSMGASDGRAISFIANVRNRGPANALDMQWSAKQAASNLKVRNSPAFLLVLHDHQCVLEIPLDSRGLPVSIPVELTVQFSDEEGTRSVRWCLQCFPAPNSHHRSWTLEDLDCISFKPKRFRNTT